MLKEIVECLDKEGGLDLKKGRPTKDSLTAKSRKNNVREQKIGRTTDQSLNINYPFRDTASGQPRIAIIYDFDKTLSPKDMQEYGIIENLGMTAGDFWSQVTELANSEGMDSILAYTYLMIEKSRQSNTPITKNTFAKVGQDIEFFKGVGPEQKPDGSISVNWFERINHFCQDLDLQVEHYIISSGIKEIIMATPIAQYFTRVYACDFLYDEQGQILWPKNTINYTTKTQFIFRINKGVLDVNSQSDRLLNYYTPENRRRIPFSNMIYIGDGFTDVPCMKLVKSHGGHSIAIFNKDSEHEIFNDTQNNTATMLLKSNRVNTIANADYSENSPLEKVVKTIIEKIKADETLKATIPLLSDDSYTQE